eukprot:COSAG01_NODE_5007_length_4548_cov_5.216903_4_plen_46_part_00
MNQATIFQSMAPLLIGYHWILPKGKDEGGQRRETVYYGEITAGRP